MTIRLAQSILKYVEQVVRTLRSFYDYRKAVELRHKSWSENKDQVTALFEENRASGVLIAFTYRPYRKCFANFSSGGLLLDFH